jgi:hypothetical protein
MAKELDTGMDKQDMKRLLMKSKSEPVNCSFATGDLDKTVALLMLDKVKAPKAVDKDLQKKFPNAGNTRWGTASVDIENDPKLVVFTINKPISGIARKLAKTLKGTGFSKVEIVLEDGSPVERHSEEEEIPAGVAADISPTQPVMPVAPPSPGAAAAAAAVPPAVAPKHPEHLDPSALAHALAGLIKRIPQAVAAAPNLQDELTRLASDANANLKTHDLPGAAMGIDALRRLLDDPASGSPPIQAPPGAPRSTSYAKLRAVWLAARKKVETDIEKLHQECLAAYAQEGIAPQLDAGFRARIAPVLATLDESLAQKLAQAAAAPDEAEQATLAKQAHEILLGYMRFVAEDKIIGELDKNPFVPLQIGATLTGTLDALNKSMRLAA